MKKVFLILALAHIAPPLHAETVGCTGITSLPATISAPGIYCLDSDLVLSPPYPEGITIASDDVILDLNGHSVTAVPDSAGIGIYSFNRQRVVVKNGTVRGFAMGVELYGTSSGSSVLFGLEVDSMKVEATRTGISVQSSRGASITRCSVTIRSTATGVPATGIRFAGDSGTVSDNDVFSLFPLSATGYGILLSNTNNSVVEGNRVKNGPGTTGVYVIGNNNLVVSNLATNVGTGFWFVGAQAAKYRDNIVMGTSLSYYGGTNAGNNQ